MTFHLKVVRNLLLIMKFLFKKKKLKKELKKLWSVYYQFPQSSKLQQQQQKLILRI